MYDRDALTYSPSRSRPPKIPLSRRGWAFSVDFMAAWLLSSLLGGNPGAQALTFLLAWLGLRVILPVKNYGQSLGRWTFDLKLIETRYNRVPGFMELSKREGITGLAALLALTGFTNLSPVNGVYLLLMLPLALDCGVAFADPTDQLAFHDRLAGTLVIGTHRGYSLDLKVKKWVAIVQQRVKQ